MDTETKQMFELVLKKMDEGFGKVNSRLDKVDERLENLDARLGKVEVRLGKVEVRLDKVDARLDKVDARLDNLERRVGGLEASMEDVKLNFALMFERFDAIENDIKDIKDRLLKLEMAVEHTLPEQIKMLGEGIMLSNEKNTQTILDVVGINARLERLEFTQAKMLKQA